MVDGILSFIFFSKSPLWITIGINNFEGLNISLNIIARSIENMCRKSKWIVLSVKGQNGFNPEEKQRPGFGTGIYKLYGINYAVK